MPFFSIVIPLFNKEKFVKNTLQSVLSQTFNDYEIIIVDDGSTDASVAIIKEIISDKIQLIQQKNQGVAKAKNVGIKHAKSKFIALIDADDTWYSNHLEELKKQIGIYPNAGLYCNNYEILYTPEIKKPALFNFNYKTDCLLIEDFFKASIINSVAWTSAVAFSKEIFERVGGFNTNYNTCEDLDMWLRLALRYDVSFNPTITMTYKSYIADSLTKHTNNNTREIFLNAFENEALKNKSLKTYLDVNRYAIAVRCKLSKEKLLFKRLKNGISKHNLNLKQHIILNSPRLLVIVMLKLQKFLIKKGMYLSAFK